jgi:NADH dehydrogenase (ubiquinone) 1 alpha subcomplex subunit 12
MSHGHFVRALREFGVRGTMLKLYKMRTLKFGRLVGTDKAGNQYFENAEDYPYLQHRWVEYVGNKPWYEIDSSNVPPEWHGWLHGVTAEPPTAVSRRARCSRVGAKRGRAKVWGYD